MAMKIYARRRNAGVGTKLLSNGEKKRFTAGKTQFWNSGAPTRKPLAEILHMILTREASLRAATRFLGENCGSQGDFAKFRSDVRGLGGRNCPMCRALERPSSRPLILSRVSRLSQTLVETVVSDCLFVVHGIKRTYA